VRLYSKTLIWNIVFVIQDTAVTVCQPKLSAPPLKTEVGLSEHTSFNGLSGVPVITSVPVSKVEQSEDWKQLETEDWKSWKEEESEPMAASFTATHSNDGYAVCNSTVPAETVATVSSGQVCDRVKTEQGLNYSTVGSSSSSSLDVRPGRMIASVAPCTPVQPNEQLSLWKVPVPLTGHPPPLLHSTSHSQPSTSPLPTSVIRSPVVIDETSTPSQNDSDDSEQELKNHSPSPEPRLVNEECHRSKNAMYDIVCYCYIVYEIFAITFI